jgi:putative hydrolase of the HAD superfamily
VFPMPNVKQTLAACRQRRLTMGIISNAQFYTPYLFAQLLGKNMESLGFYSDLILFSYELGHAKPSPHLFDIMRDRLGRRKIPPDAVLYVGNDMLNDIYPASITGFNTALFAGDARSLRLRESEPKCRGLVPDLVVIDLMQLAEHLTT